jgi:hypothetical protein
VCMDFWPDLSSFLFLCHWPMCVGVRSLFLSLFLCPRLVYMGRHGLTDFRPVCVDFRLDLSSSLSLSLAGVCGLAWVDRFPAGSNFLSLSLSQADVFCCRYALLLLF